MIFAPEEKPIGPDQEQVLFRMRSSQSAPLLFFFFAIVCVAIRNIVSETPSAPQQYLLFLCFLFWLVFLGFFLISVIALFRTSIKVSAFRLCGTCLGRILPERIEIAINEIDSIEVFESPLSKSLHFGHMKIYLFHGKPATLRYIVNPKRAAELIMSLRKNEEKK